VKVVTVRVSPDDPVHVNELRTYGVEPITLSLTAIPATVAYAPEAVSVSGTLMCAPRPSDRMYRHIASW
jgi:hypothetical protein